MWGKMRTFGKHTRKEDLTITAQSLALLVRPAGFEPATYGFVVRYSIRLSYGRIYAN